MYCIECGKKIENTKFCLYCGAKQGIDECLKEVEVIKENMLLDDDNITKFEVFTRIENEKLKVLNGIRVALMVIEFLFFVVTGILILMIMHNVSLWGWGYYFR